MKLKKTHITLTPNARLARFLQRTGTDSSARILPINVWLKTLWQEYLFIAPEPITLLSTDQELLLWERIIEEANPELLQTRSTAKLAGQAYEFLQQANLSLKDVNSDLLEVNTFLSWAEKIESHCKQNNFVLPSALINKIIPIIESEKSEFQIHSFDQITSQLKRLLTTLEQQGCKITYTSLNIEPNKIVRTHFKNQAEELLAMARHAKYLHEHEPTATQTYVIPTLETIRHDVVKKFYNVFFPEALFKPDFKTDLINISGGTPLSFAPIINIAIEILNLRTDVVQLETLSTLLNSPFCGSLESLPQRALIDLKFRDYQESELSWNFILKHYEPFTAWRNLRKILTGKKLLSEWSNDFYTLIITFGWMKDRSLNSEEYQQVQRFYKLLKDAKQWDIDNALLDYNSALHILLSQLNDTLFQKETVDGPIQVLGLLEAAGQTSDYCWVMGSDDKTFPGEIKPNPFLPRVLQKKYNMPHSSAERELTFSKNMIARFNQSAKTIIYSYHETDNERELRVSPLIYSINTIEPEQLSYADYQPLTEQYFEQQSIEYFEDDVAPSITEKLSSGGSGIFTKQATCPFQAFAYFRLKATEFPTRVEGLTAMERGTLIHTALEFIWTTLKTQEALLSLHEDSLHKLIDLAIDASFKKEFPHFTLRLSPVFKTIEHQRLFNLLHEWLTLEKTRPPFKVIANEEKKVSHLNDLHFTVKIDRIDELENGDHLIIDYKTGKPNKNDWFPPRLTQPQLPLYCITEEQTDAIAFGRISPDEVKFSGISHNETKIKGIDSTDWTSLVNAWNIELNQLAHDFKAGVATVDPVNELACTYCEFQSLCRIKEQRGVE
jgi:ATP-dependent helicase/nuclease subunit B